MERKNKVLTVIVTVLMLVIFGLVGFIIYDKVINKTNKPNNEVISNEIKEVDLSSSLVTSLKYPHLGYDNLVVLGVEYQNINRTDMSRAELMYLAVNETEALKEPNDYPNSCVVDGEVLPSESCDFYSADAIKQNFKMLFGPDVNYYDGDIDGALCQHIDHYDKENKIYASFLECGGDSDSTIEYINKPYKAEQIGDYLYVYEYVQVLRHENDHEHVYLSNKNLEYVMEISSSISKQEIYNLMDDGKSETYKWTFKKQSDGNYYFYSGSWEN